jgi:hypothetical protein
MSFVVFISMQCFDAGFPEALLHSFDAVVVDPPFITREVWEKYAVSCKALLRSDPSEAVPAAEGKCQVVEAGPDLEAPSGLAAAAARGDVVIATTINENSGFMQELLGVKPNAWQPSIPNLVYQYDLYTNYSSQRFDQPNPEIPSWDD